MNWIDKIYKEIGCNDCQQDVSDWLGTGLLPLNKAISGRYSGGIPVGRITEVYGGPSAGKTLLATMAMIQTQQKGGLAVFLDYEHAFSLSRARKLGLNDDKMCWIYKQPTTAEEGFHIVEFIANTVREKHPDKFVTVVKDSVASMVTKEELEADYGEGNMRTKLSLPSCMSVSLKKLAPMVSKTNITLIFLNQTRDNPGVMFGDKEKTPGGNALKFYASVRVRLSKSGKIKDGDEIIGENVLANVVKNKVYEPFKKTQYVTHLTHGINLEMSHIEALDAMGKLGSTKGYVEFGGKKYRKKALCRMLQDHPAEYDDFLSLFEDGKPVKKAA